MVQRVAYNRHLSGCKKEPVRDTTKVSVDRRGAGVAHAELFRDLYQECYPHVLAYATSLVGRQAGEDITSETFAIAWRRRAEVQPVGLPWLLGVARNLVRELRRRDAKQYELAVAEGARISASGELNDPAEDVAERLAVLEALARLSDADRELLTLIAWQGLSQSEAAAVLGCSNATLSVRLHRARRRLEKAMGAPKAPNPGAGEVRADQSSGMPRSGPQARAAVASRAGKPAAKSHPAAEPAAASAHARRVPCLMKETEGA
jgi:RNA polymerase sigma-70 factor (ECF subfamily)